MTFLGKIVMGLALLVIGTGVFYGVTSFVKHDNEQLAEQENIQEAATSQSDISQTSTTTVATSTVASSTPSQADMNAKANKKIPFKDYLAKGGSYKCTITQTIASMISSGVVYMHDSLLRIELSSSISGQTLDTTMITKDGYVYSWTNLAPGKGYKVKVPTSGQGSGTSKVYVWDGAQVGDYSCEAWTADDSMFELPKSVTFATQ